MDEKVYNDCVMLPAEAQTQPRQKKKRKSVYFHTIEQKVYILQHFLASGIRHAFDAWGYAVATRPALFACLSVAAAIVFTSLGALRFRMSQDVHTGYLAKEAEAMHELEVYKAFYGSEGRPYYFGLMIRPGEGRCNGSMLDEECFDETQDLHEYVFSNMSVDFRGRPTTFDQMCGSLCMTDEPLWVFKRPWETRNEASFDANSVHLKHPISTIYGFKVNMAPFMYDVQKSEDGDIESAGLLCLWYASDSRGNATDEETLRRWELAAFERTVDGEKDAKEARWPSLHIVPYGNYVVNEEVMRAGSGVTPHYSVGLVCMLVFMALSSLLSTAYHAGAFRWPALGLSFAAILGPVLATCQTFGIIALMDYSINVMMMIAPFLILAIGVDDAFLLLHSWQRHTHDPGTAHKSRRSRLRLVLSEIGPSMLITSLTNSVAFSIGAFASPPEISKFCAAVALGMVAIFLNQLCFFSPLMVLFMDGATAPAPQPTDCGSWRARTIAGWRAVVDAADWLVGLLARALCSAPGRMVAALSFAVYLYISVQGVLLMKAEMRPEVLIPEDSILQETFHLRHEHVWKEYQPISVIVNKQVDLEDPKNYAQVHSLVNDLETMPHATGKDLTMFWLREYQNWRDIQDTDDSWLAFESDDYDLNPENRRNDSVRMDALAVFLKMEQYAHWQTAVRYHLSNDTSRKKFIVDKFLFQVAYSNISSLGDRARAVQSWRQTIAQHHETLNATLWDPDAPHADIMLNVRAITAKTLLLTLCSMALACFLFIPNTAGLLCAVAAIASTSTGVTGLLHWWHADLDPVLMADLIMAIGFSVDYTAHASFHFYRIGAGRLHCPQAISGATGAKATVKERSVARLHETYRSVLWPTIQAGMSTIMCMAPQSLSPMRAHIIFVKTVVLVVCLGILHGMFWVPTLLAALPPSWTGERPADGSPSAEASAREPCKPSGDNSTATTAALCNGQSTSKQTAVAVDGTTPAADCDVERNGADPLLQRDGQEDNDDV